MKIGIMSDCHLGEHRFRKITEHGQNAYCTLNNELFLYGLKIFEENNVDSIIISGDLFDSPNPDIQSIILSSKLKDLRRKNNDKDNNNNPIKTYILGGNHEYSQKSMSCGYHAFNILNSDNISSIYEETEIFENDEICLTFIPYKSLNCESFNMIYNGTLKEKRKKDIKKYNKERRHILIFHGFVDLNNEYIQDLNENDKGQKENLFAMPSKVASNYDLVISGHIHLSSFIKTDTVKILTPGSLMPSAQANEKNYNPGVYIYDTDTNNIEFFNLKKAPRIFNIITDDINKTLQEISENKFYNNLYFISYNGKMKDIDEYLYKIAVRNALNISIKTNETYDKFKNDSHEICDFWNFIKEKYPDYYDEFKVFNGDNDVDSQEERK